MKTEHEILIEIATCDMRIKYNKEVMYKNQIAEVRKDTSREREMITHYKKRKDTLQWVLGI